MAKLKSHHSTRNLRWRKSKGESERQTQREEENCVDVRYFKESSKWFLYSCHENLAHDANKTITMTSLHGLLLKMIQPSPRDDDDDDDVENENMS